MGIDLGLGGQIFVAEIAETGYICGEDKVAADLNLCPAGPIWLGSKIKSLAGRLARP